MGHFLWLCEITRGYVHPEVQVNRAMSAAPVAPFHPGENGSRSVAMAADQPVPSGHPSCENRELFISEGQTKEILGFQGVDWYSKRW